MAQGVPSWSKTAATNASADSTINWAEGQSPSSVNDSARAMMARLAEFRDDTAGSLTTGGTATAYTLTTNKVFASLTELDGQTLAIKFNATSGAAPTLAVDGLTAKAIAVDHSATAVGTGVIKANSVWRVTYYNAGNCFILNNVPAIIQDGTVAAQSLASNAVTTVKILDANVTAAKLAANAVTPANASSALYGFPLGLLNGGLSCSVGTNLLTVAIKTAAGTDPSATDPAVFLFRNSTIATGDYTAVSVTAALSMNTNAVGATFGVGNNTAFRLWIVAFNNSGTVVLGLINCLNGTSVFALDETATASSTAVSGSATSAQTFYTPNGTTISSKAYVIIGFLEYSAGLATAGTYNIAPTKVQIFRAGIKRPGDVVQTPGNTTGAVATGTTVVPADDTIPQSSEGDQYLSQAITPTSAANILEVDFLAQLGASANNTLVASLFQDATANALVSTSITTGGFSPMAAKGTWSLLAATTSSTTFKVRAGGPLAGTTVLNGATGGTRLYGGVMNSYIRVREIMA